MYTDKLLLKMLSEDTQQKIINEFKSLSVNTELSYETWVHKKVYDAKYVSAIPEGKKVYAWFTTYEKQNVCFLMELQKREVVKVKTALTSFHNKMAFGTVLYGTFFQYDHNPFFCIEDILQYKSKIITKITPKNEKLKIYEEIFSMEYLRQNICMKNQLVFGLPIMSSNVDDLLKQLNCLPYKIKYIQFHYDDKKYSMDYNEMQQRQFTPYNTSTTNNKYKTQGPQVYIDPNKEVVFRITAHVQNDIYNLFLYNPRAETDDKFEFYEIALIPDYKTSVFMNNYFRKIKENQNLDALEESDDEDEFQDDRIDKFVNLNKKYNIICKFNNKFKKWVPCFLAGRNERTATKIDIQSLNKSKENQGVYIFQKNVTQNYNNNPNPNYNPNYNQNYNPSYKKKYNDSIRRPVKNEHYKSSSIQ